MLALGLPKNDPEQGTNVEVEVAAAIEITPDTVAEAVASLVGANIASIESVSYTHLTLPTKA